MTYFVRTWTTQLGPWDEEMQDYPMIDHWGELEGFDSVTEVIDFLDDNGFNEPSSYPQATPNTWLIAATTQNAYSGNTEERTASRVEGFSDEEWVHVINRVRII